MLSQVDSDSFIFRKYDGTPLPIDLTTLEDVCVFHVLQHALNVLMHIS